MAILHYGNAQIELTDQEVDSFTSEGPRLSKPGLVSQQLASGWIHLVTGPGIPIWIDQREQREETPTHGVR